MDTQRYGAVRGAGRRIHIQTLRDAIAENDKATKALKKNIGEITATIKTTNEEIDRLLRDLNVLGEHMASAE